nr:unnamed protein product [Callosobruchus analis]
MNNLSLTDEIHTLGLFCDGCGRQNRNSYIIHILYYWLKFKSPPSVTEIITYLVRGHSCLPADNVFGRLEKDIRKHPVLSSKKYHEAIYEKHGNIKSLDSDNGWKILSTKALEEKLKKIQGIADMKVIKLKKTSKNDVSVCGFQ